MMKCRFKCATLFALCLCAFSLLEAAAQPADVLRRLNAKYDRVTQFDDGLARVSKNSRHGYVDTLGKVVVPLVYDDAVRFHNGYAAVGKGRVRRPEMGADRPLGP